MPASNPKKSTTTPKQKATKEKAPRKPTADDLNYLAGMYEATIGLRGVNTTGAAGISNTEMWPRYMAKTFGGEARQFTSTKGKVFWGWFVDLPQRLQILDWLESNKSFRTIEPLDRDAIRSKIESMIEKLKDRKDRE